MNRRRQFLLAPLVLGLGPATAAPKSSPRVIGRQALPEPFDGREATFVEVSYAPGASSPPHRHAGFILGYVIEGKLRFQAGDGPVQELGPGEVFYEHPGAVHSVSANALTDRPTRILAVQIAPRGSKLVDPVTEDPTRR